MPTVRKGLILLAPALLLLVAGWQAVRVETHDQSPWLGAGFAMFSYVDNSALRPVVATDHATGDEVPIPAELGGSTARLAAAPTAVRASALASDIEARTGHSVVVTVYRPIYDPAGPTIRVQQVASSGSPP